MGKIVKNIVLILVGFLVISMIFAAFSNTSKTTSVQISDISEQLNQGKVESLTITDSAVTAKLKDNDTLEEAKIVTGADAVGFFKNTGVDPSKLTPDKVKISYSNGSAWSNLAGPVLSILLPFLLLSVIIYFFMRQVQGTNNRAMSFGQSSVKLNDERKNRMKFSDVAN
ncbi:MAG TPA: ATP-dependent metallopeptidase FtsH/Yme1/Tma family protein, partial [Candidatus Limnocylindria bacterium]|nr:ATP-dependent metallopeptidase FtsH/Yme1/Tma family protein [Candidatus Limnocylindria bacterium]